jgi:hypothetical protein
VSTQYDSQLPGGKLPPQTADGERDDDEKDAEEDGIDEEDDGIDEEEDGIDEEEDGIDEEDDGIDEFQQGKDSTVSICESTHARPNCVTASIKTQNSNKRKVCESDTAMVTTPDRSTNSITNNTKRSRLDSPIVPTQIIDLSNDDVHAVSAATVVNSAPVSANTRAHVSNATTTPQQLADDFICKVMQPLLRRYGPSLIKLNQRAQITAGRNSKSPASSVDLESPTGMWFHIFNSDSWSKSKMQKAKSTNPKNWRTCVQLNMYLEKQLAASTNAGTFRHAIVEVAGDGTCQMNAILTNLYLRKFFRDEISSRAAKKLAPLITATHLKRWTMCHIAWRSQERMPNDPRQTLMSTFKMHHPHANYLTLHPHNVVSLEDEYEDVLREADSGKCATDSAIVKLAAAIRLTTSPPPGTNLDELAAATTILVEHYCSFDACRHAVYQDFLEECKEGMRQSKHSEELQLRTVWGLLRGVNCDLFNFVDTNSGGYWLSFNDEHSDSNEQDSIASSGEEIDKTRVILLKTFNHYFTALDLAETEDDLVVPQVDKKRYRAMTGLWEYPAMDKVNLQQKIVVDRISKVVVETWREHDSKFMSKYKLNLKRM